MTRIKGFDKQRTINRIRLLAEEGEMTAPEIADELKISVGTVYRYRDEYGIHIIEGKKGRKPVEKNLNPEDRIQTKIAYFANMGLSMDETSRKLTLPVAVVGAIAKRFEIEFKGNGQ